MSNNINEDTHPQATAGNADAAPSARKRVTKKAATKTTIKEVTENVPAKKVASKKIAAKRSTVKKAAAKKSAVKKAAVAPSQTELPLAPPPAQKAPPTPVAESTRPPRPARAPRAKKVAAEPAATSTAAPPQEAPPEPSANTSRRFGRVPGGGPTAIREPADDAQPTPPPQGPPPPREPNPLGPRDPKPAQQHQESQQNPQQGDAQGSQNPQGPPRESRSKRRREKRKRRNGERQEQGGHSHQSQHGNRQRHDSHGNHRHDSHGNQRHDSHGNQRRDSHGNQHDASERRQVQLNGPKVEANGMLELAPKGFGFLRVQSKNFEQARDDVFVTPETIRKFNLRLGQWIEGFYQEGPRGPQLVEITRINEMPPEEAAKLPHFDELKAINPTRRISFETTPERFTTRVIDIMAPVGRGQRGLIVSPPRSGKTTLLLHMAEAIREKYDEAIHLMVVLVDERPEEVTEFRRALPGAEIYASSNDEQPRNHCRIAELAIERAKRLVEAGKDVFLLMDSITRLARAYNSGMNNRGRGTGSGGITIGALEIPRRLFAAARNTRGGGSLTILATALIQTNSRADEAIFMEFKGTGNMELVLDRKIAENYIYPAVDIFKSGTRREELLLADHMLHKIHLIRRGLSGHRPAEAMERLLFFLKKFPNNPQMLLEIKG